MPDYRLLRIERRGPVIFLHWTGYTSVCHRGMGGMYVPSVLPPRVDLVSILEVGSQLIFHWASGGTSIHHFLRENYWNPANAPEFNEPVIVVPPVTTNPGKIVWPRPRDTINFNLGTFHNPNYTAQFGRTHEGVDFVARRGTNFFAMADGRVVYARNTGSNTNGGGWGLYLIIDAGVIDGHHIHYAYAHMDAFGVNIGDHVTAGQVIGQVGMTGATTGAHAHFEIYRDANIPYDPPTNIAGDIGQRNGTRIDPVAWLDAHVNG